LSGAVSCTWGLRRLVINADDFGLTAGVNRAIAEAHARGVLTSTTVMAHSAAFDDASRLHAQNPRLGIGCHIVLVDGAPVVAPHLVPSLLQHGTSFRRTLTQVGLAVARGRINAAEVEAEAIAQMSALQSAGLRLSHFDTHKHVHVFPSLLKPLLRAARACGIQAVRNPFSPARCLPWEQVLRHPEMWRRFVAVSLFRGFAPDFRRLVERDGMATTDGALGVVETGMLSLELLHIILANMPEGTWELVCHPGYHDAELSAARTRLRESRAREFDILTSPAVRGLLDEHHVELITFWDLQSGSAGTQQPNRRAV
jgi:chitin disaccharide deacetylase